MAIPPVFCNIRFIQIERKSAKKPFLLTFQWLNPIETKRGRKRSQLHRHKLLLIIIIIMLDIRLAELSFAHPAVSSAGSNNKINVKSVNICDD